MDEPKLRTAPKSPHAPDPLRTRETTAALAYGGIAVALGAVLSLVAVSKLPQGGSVTAASMLPTILVALFFGPAWGALAGAVNGLVQLLLNPYVVHPVQVLLDYPVAFGAVGLAGLATLGSVRRTRGADVLGRIAGLPWHAPVLGTLLAMAGRFGAHFLSGVVFFGTFAPEGQSAWLYSLLYNAAYMVPETLVTLVGAVLVTLLALGLRRARRPARKAPPPPPAVL